MDGDDRTWMRDLGALLALPSLWVDHSPAEIADGLLSVLIGMLRLESAYARFGIPGDGEPLEAWRPSGPAAPPDLLAAIGPGGETDRVHPEPGVTTAAVRAAETDGAPAGTIARVATLALALPWGTGLVAVSAPRADFPTERETHLLRVAVGQAAIALHTARRLAGEQSARRRAEHEAERQRRLLGSLLDEVGPALSAVSRRVQEVSREAERPEAAQALTLSGSLGTPSLTSTSGIPQQPSPVTPALTRRELEVLGLLAQGLSNK